MSRDFWSLNSSNQIQFSDSKVIKELDFSEGLKSIECEAEAIKTLKSKFKKAFFAKKCYISLIEDEDKQFVPDGNLANQAIFLSTRNWNSFFKHPVPVLSLHFLNDDKRLEQKIEIQIESKNLSFRKFCQHVYHLVSKLKSRPCISIFYFSIEKKLVVHIR